MHPRSAIAVLVAAVLLTACGAAPVKTASTPYYPPRHMRADGHIGAGIPAPTPTPGPITTTHVGLKISIPALGILLPLTNGQLPEPRLYDAEAYPNMKWPGEGGKSFIYAHAQYGPPVMFGPLLAARQSAVGDKVLVMEPDGRVLHYSIVSWTGNWPVTDTSILAPTDHEEMVLYTCTSWNYNDPKVVAIAEPDPQFVTPN
jgi:LPXTG-site transpeptidase (sortase) family protein